MFCREVVNSQWSIVICHLQKGKARPPDFTCAIVTRKCGNKTTHQLGIVWLCRPGARSKDTFGEVLRHPGSGGSVDPGPQGVYEVPRSSALGSHLQRRISS